MPELSERERIEILMMIGFGDRRRTHQEVCYLFNDIHPNRQISRSQVTKTLQRYNRRGTVGNLSKSGRSKTATNENVAQNIAISLEENPHMSTAELANMHEISRRSVGRILKREKYHPYKIHLVQQLSEDDFDRRLEFCETMMDICNRDNNFTRNVVFSDEATFCLNGTVNRHNCRYWSQTNPHWVQDNHTQHPQKLNVWAGIYNNRIVGPFFLEEILNGDRYLDLLNTQVVPTLEENGQLPNNIWFQQDGAPPHYARIVRDCLDRTFHHRWIGRRGTIEWPARSPDLTPLDFFLWGYLKSKVYFNRPNSLQELAERITEEINRIPPQVISNVIREFINRLAYCQEVNGAQFEHLIH